MQVILGIAQLLAPFLPNIWLVITVSSLISISILLTTIKFSKFNRFQLFIVSVLIVFTSVFAVHLYFAALAKGASTGPPSLNSNTPKNEDTNKTGESIPINCGSWDYCTDFRTDQSLENKYYRHVSEDPQKIILEGGPFANPPLYLNKDFSPLFKAKLDVQPLELNSGNVIIEAREMFQIFIGDNDYRSFAFLYWNPTEGSWERRKDSKEYLPSGKDILPRTQFTIEIETRKKGNQAEVSFSINYKNMKGENDKTSFKRIVNIPSSRPEDFLTKIGVALYRVKANIPQAKFFFLGIKQN